VFLSELNEHERTQFLDLAGAAMKSDGTIEAAELEVFETYAHECLMDGYKPADRAVAEITASLADSTPQAKRIVLMELMGIWAADNSWDDGEIAMMYQVGKAFGIPESMVNRLRRWTRELRALIAEGCELIAR